MVCIVAAMGIELKRHRVAFVVRRLGTYAYLMVRKGWRRGTVQQRHRGMAASKKEQALYRFLDMYNKKLTP